MISDVIGWMATTNDQARRKKKKDFERSEQTLCEIWEMAGRVPYTFGSIFICDHMTALFSLDLSDLEGFGFF